MIRPPSIPEPRRSTTTAEEGEAAASAGSPAAAWPAPFAMPAGDPPVVRGTWLDAAPLLDAGAPAVSSTSIGSWRLRFAGGVLRRANSVWARGEAGDGPALLAAIGRVEDEYRRRGVRASFQLTGAVDPTLVRTLRGHGYRFVERGWTLTTPPPAESASTNPNGRSAPGDADVLGLDWDLADEPSAGWLEGMQASRGCTPAQTRWIERVYRGGPARYVTARDDSGVAAIGRVSLHPREETPDGLDWGGVCAVWTRRDLRRRGVARELMRRAGADAAEHGVHRLWLQVDAGNAAALALYASLGFEAVDGYVYAVAPDRASCC